MNFKGVPCPSCGKKGLHYPAHPHAQGHKDFSRIKCRYCGKLFEAREIEAVPAYATIRDLQQAARRGAVTIAECQAFRDKCDLYVYGPSSEILFSGAVGPQEVAMLLGLRAEGV